MSNNCSWKSVRKQSSEKIMNTDIMCEIDFLPGQEDLAQKSLDQIFVMFREFEKRYSRFIKGNVLSRFNASTSFTLSEEFFDLLSLAKRYHESTQKIFDPSILPDLEAEGYIGAHSGIRPEEKRDFSELILDRTTLKAMKPRNLVIDLGGIGKGFIVDRAADYLGKHFKHFIIDAGGDIFAKGGNQKERYTYWAVNVEHPQPGNDPATLLTFSDMAVATSGVNRRH